MSTLITGGYGFLGLNLATQLVERGERVVLFDIQPKSLPPSLLDVESVQGDLASFSQVLDVVKRFKVDTIYHCGALLSQAAEESPLKAYEVNTLGTWYVLEAARLFEVENVIFTSTIAAFGSHIEDPTPNVSPQLPTTLYGVSKVSSERLGEYYHSKFGLNFRGVRFPSVIGPGRGEGGASAYSSLMIERAVCGESYTVFVEPSCVIPLLYSKDAVNALITLKEAEESNLRHRMYNVHGFSPTAGEIAKELERLLKETGLSFLPQPSMVEIVESWPVALDDSEARKDWGWEAKFNLEKTIEDFIRVLKD